MQIENKHLALSSSTRDDSAFFFDEAPFLVESNLHALLNHLADRDQILCDGGNMQDICNVCLLTSFAEWNIADVPNRVRSVISGFDMLRINLKCGLVCELTLRVNRHSKGQESPLSPHYVF